MPYNPDSFQQSLDSMPAVKPELHFFLNDYAQRIIEDKKPSEEEADILDQIFIRLQTLDQDLVSYLLAKKENDLTKEEVGITAGYFLASKLLGPSSEELRDMMYYGLVDVDTFRDKAVSLAMPEHTRFIIVQTYTKIKS